MRKLALKPRWVWLSVIAATMISPLFMFQNCSDVEFAQNKAALLSRLNSSGGILINNGAEFTNLEDVQVSLEHSSATEVYLTNVSDCSSGGTWQAKSPNAPWKLDRLNTEAKVYGKFRESATNGIESQCYEDAIVHDNIPPKATIIKSIDAFISAVAADMTWSAVDENSGVDKQQCSIDGGAQELCNSAYAKNGLAEGPHAYSVVVNDQAGNVAAPVSVSFVVDRTPPTVVINQGPAAVTADLNASFSFSGADALSGIKGYECKANAAAAFTACTSPAAFVYAEGAQVFEVRSQDKAGNYSAPAVHRWTIDKTAPTVKIVTGPKAYEAVATATITFEGFDGNVAITKFECSLDNAAFVACTSPANYAGLAAGNHSFSVRGFDAAGNLSQPASINWMIDLTAPQVAIISGPAAVTKEVIANIAFSATDPESGIDRTECQIDGGGYQACTSVKTYMALLEGNHAVQVRAFDKAGNVSNVANHPWKIDLTAPVVTITKKPNAQEKVSVADFEFTATDANAGVIALIECQLDNGGYQACTSPKQYTGVLDGTHNFFVRATDQAGNVSAIQTAAWLVDTLAPAINFAKVPAAVIDSKTAAEVIFTVADVGVGVQTVQCGLNGALAACNANDTKVFNNLATGNYTFSVIATDKLGNSAQKDTSWKVEFLTEDHNQAVNVTVNKKADVLVVLDNSGSMDTEQKNMAQRFGTFLDQLNGLEWQVAITSTDPRADRIFGDGKFFPLRTSANVATGQYILKSTQDLAQAKDWFAGTIKRNASEGSGDEQGIRATYRSVQRALTVSAENAQNNAFVRAGATLSVVVVTDADETNPAGTQDFNKPAKLLELVQASYPGKKFAFHSIVVKSGDNVCRNKDGNEGFGVAYEAASTLTGGLVGSVCEQDYGAQLKNMAQAVVDLVNTVTLECEPLDVNGDGKGDVTVTTADGSAAPSYTITGVTLKFATGLPAGTNALKYSCLKK